MWAQKWWNIFNYCELTTGRNFSELSQTNPLFHFIFKYYMQSIEKAVNSLQLLNAIWNWKLKDIMLETCTQEHVYSLLWLSAHTIVNFKEEPSYPFYPCITDLIKSCIKYMTNIYIYIYNSRRFMETCPEMSVNYERSREW